MSKHDTYIPLPELENYSGSISGIIQVLQRYQRRYPGHDLLINAVNRKALVRLVVKGKEKPTTKIEVDEIKDNQQIMDNVLNGNEKKYYNQQNERE